MTLLTGQYYSIESGVDVEITRSRSRFIASLRFAQDRSAFDIKMKEVIARYPKASHYCWAYRFEGSHVLEHASDDGEPAGTAGRPILGALKKYDLQNTMAVVTRYYGGVKLGVKGLISAYADVTLNAIETSKIIVTEPQSKIVFTVDYDLYNLLLSRLEKYALQQDAFQTVFSDVISGEITIPNSIRNSLVSELDSISANRTLFDFTVD